MHQYLQLISTLDYCCFLFRWQYTNILRYLLWCHIEAHIFNQLIQGRIQDLKLGGGALKKIAPSEGRRENFEGISCEKSRFYAKKSYFFQLRREARKILGYFVWKITILRQKIIFFPILGDKVYPGTPASSTTKTGRHDIAEILLKVAY